MCNHILNLPTVIVSAILDYVKTDSYAIIGAVCQNFKRQFGESEKVTRTCKYLQSVSLLDTLRPTTKFRSSNLLDNLISYGDIRIIPRLLSRGVEWDPFCVERAAEVCNYDFFHWLKTTDLPWLPENAHHKAALAGNLGMMVFLVDSGAGFPDSRSHAAAFNDRKITEWLGELQLDVAYTLVRAARTDDVQAFEQTEFFDDHSLNQMLLKEACINSSFNVLEFFRCFFDVGPTVSDVAAALFFHRDGVLEWYWEFYPDLASDLAEKLRFKN